MIQRLFRIDGFVAAILAIFLLGTNLAAAQVMPAPHKSPRVPVGRQALSEGDKAAIRTRDVKGPATIIDGEHLRIGDADLRLFGIVPPQLSASFGPQARSALDEVTHGQDVECHIRDRDHDGRFLAACATVSTKADLALELLKRGLAVVARGSVQPTDLAAPYVAAEQAAEAQKLGLWSTAMPPAAVLAAAPPAVTSPPKAESNNVPPLASELKKEEKPAAAIAPLAPAPANVTLPVQKTLPALPPPVVISASMPDENAGVPGFFARYQLLITALVIVGTALGIMIVLAVERRKDRRDEMKAIAAALRGELLAARAVCQARLKNWTDADEKSATWPRVRATLYQAYVGKLGWLGANLARQVASIYGQAADYAAYFNPMTGAVDTRETASKHQALQALVQHIEEVLPQLAVVEQTGCRPTGIQKAAKPAPAISANAAPVRNAARPVYTATVQAAAPLWDIVKKFTPVRRHASRPPIAEEAITDYTALIEEEIARMSAEEENETSSSVNVTKIRGTGA